MTLRSKREVELTREKLRGLEELYARTETSSADSPYARELTLRSLRRTINQLKEEIVRFESRAGTSSEGKRQPHQQG